MDRIDTMNVTGAIRSAKKEGVSYEDFIKQIHGLWHPKPEHKKEHKDHKITNQDKKGTPP